jgi:hypothetical protein
LLFINLRLKRFIYSHFFFLFIWKLIEKIQLQKQRYKYMYSQPEDQASQSPGTGPGKAETTDISFIWETIDASIAEKIWYTNCPEGQRELQTFQL